MVSTIRWKQTWIRKRLKYWNRLGKAQIWVDDFQQIHTMTLKLNVFKPRSYIRIVKVVIVICVAVTVAYSFFNALKKRSEDKQKELDTYAEKIQLEKVKIQQARENPLGLSNNEGVSDKSEAFWIHSLL